MRRNSMKRKIRRFLAVLLSTAMCLSLVACGDEVVITEDNTQNAQVTEVTEQQEPASEVQEEDGSWAVYWYLCGSDLETNGGFATTDLDEMLQVDLPENVNVVIQTGGAAVWQNEYMDPAKIQRWLYNSEGLQLLEEQDTANMGEAQTLYEFLAFANENYPADKVAVTFWNHGGGSVNGAAFDEIYGYDSLDLSEMYQAFDAVWPADTDNPSLELVGFDTCLMATIDVAAVFQNFAKYLVASEEVEPGNGWYYTGWLGALADNSGMNGEDLGIAICNSYYEGCEAVGTQDQTTLSVTNLTKLTPLLDAYETFGQEAFVAATEEPGFFAELGRAAAQTENYGGNTREQGYTNMIDLGHLARQTAWMLPSAQNVSDALDDCIVYRVGGVYRSEATGLSCYYSYNGDPYYSLSLPKDFGTDTLAGLPAAGPMLMRAQSNTVLMTFAATENDPVKNRIFSEALKNRSEIPLPPLGPNEEYEYIPAPRYTYNTDPAPLELPKQITNVKIVDAGNGRTAENLIVQYLYLSCTADGQHCMAVLTHSERNQKAFDGLFVFPYAEKQNYIPLVTFTAQSLRVRK